MIKVFGQELSRVLAGGAASGKALEALRTHVVGRLGDIAEWHRDSSHLC
jgi:hypothetical protein